MNDNSVKDLEDIFNKAVKSGKLNVALKAKEMILKIRGFFSKKHKGACGAAKPLADWTDEELYILLSQLEESEISK